MTKTALRLLVPTAALLAALTACGGASPDDEDDARDPGPTATPSTGQATAADPATYDHPTGADEILLDVTTAGGFTSEQFQFALQPEVRVYGDGTVVVPAEPDSPDETFAPQLSGTLDEAALQQLLSMADEADLLGPDPGHDMGGGTIVSDLPSTSVLVRTDDAYAHNAYGLAFDESGDTPARERLRAFVDEAVALATDAAEEPYRPESVTLLVEDAGAARPTLADAVTWPAGGPRLAGAPGCRFYDGPAVDAVVEALESAGPDTTFTDGDRTYRVTGATVLPGDGRPCDP